jgi:membrane fusion protein (multidrug efflux system)
MAASGKRALIAGCAALAAGGAWLGLHTRMTVRAADVSAAIGPAVIAQPGTNGRQPAGSGARQGGAGQGGAATQVEIEREPLRLINPRSLQMTLELVAARAVELTAGTNGFVQSVRIQTGQSLEAQEEAVRLDGREEQLLLEKAQAGVRVAEIELRAARGKGEAVMVELAEAKLNFAKADVDLANLRLDRTIVRAPFDGRILRSRATAGAYIRAGESLGTLADLRQLTVEIPVDRSQTKVGDSLEIRVEEQAVQGRVTELLPLAERFEPLRIVLPSVASATLLIENGDGRFVPGQTVYAPLIPRQPVVEIPTETLFNSPDGSRGVRVLRRDTVREIEVELLGAVGVERMFVSGAFVEGDELVLRSSQELSDGMRVRPATPAVSPGAGENEDAARRLSPGEEVPSRPRDRF